MPKKRLARKTKRMRTVRMPACTLPVAAEADVVVAGGGTAGLVAAIAAARTGAHTLLIEKQGYLGGALTGTYCTGPGFFGDSENRQVIKGIGWEVMEHMEKAGAAIIDREHWRVQSFPESIKTIALDMVQDAGVILFLHSWASELLIRNSLIQGVIVESKSGRQFIAGRTFIDATGDADIVFMSGAPTEKLKLDRLWQTSVDLTVCNVDSSKVAKWVKDNSEKVLLEETPKATDKSSGPSPMISFIITGNQAVQPGAASSRHAGPMPNVKLLIHGTISRVQGSVAIDGTDVRELTYAEVEGRRRAMEELEYLKKNVSGYEDAFIIGESHLGVRETRRVLGEYVLTVKDLVNNARFSDVVALNCRALDRHTKGEVFEITFLQGNHDIPLRALTPQKIDNLLVAGRCISSDHDANTSLRGAATCMATGHAAGTAAALAAEEKGLIRSLDIQKLQGILRKQEAILST